MENQKREEVNTSDAEPPASPEVIRPKALCLKRRIRKVAAPSPSLKAEGKNDPLRTARSITSFIRDPINPFRCNDKRRKREADKDEEGSLLYSSSKKKMNENTTNNIYYTTSFPSTVTPSVVKQDSQLDYNNGNSFLNLGEDNGIADSSVGHKDLPVDWSLKTRIRVSSTKPFPWSRIFKSSEQASGTLAFIRCIQNDCKKQNDNKTDSLEDKKQLTYLGEKERCALDSSPGAKFYQNSLVWVHPHLPWLKMFPRMKTQIPKKISSSTIHLDNSVTDILHTNWCFSFQSLHYLLKTNQCPYFYLCASTFTVLFRSAGAACISDMHALISPTTNGLRRALKDNEIEFSMPLRKEEPVKAKKVSDKTVECGESDVDGVETDDDDDEGVEKWLEDLGIAEKYLPLINKSRDRLENENFKHIDNRPESLVFVERSQIQALVNFFLDCDGVSMDRIGPMARIPPTLLSPVGFLGGTLQAHTISSFSQNQRGEHVIDLNGPILPNTVHSLCSLLNSTQDGNFSAVLTHYQPTVAFSIMPTSDSTNMPSKLLAENLKDCGLPNAFVEQMCSKNTLNGVLTRLCAKDGFFRWS